MINTDRWFIKFISPPAACQYLTLVGELGGGDVQLLELLLELGEVGLQPGVLQLGLIQLALELLVIRCQQLVVAEKLTVCLVQPGTKKKKKKKKMYSI